MTTISEIGSPNNADQESMLSLEDLNILEHQFLCCYPINQIGWQHIKKLSWEAQEQIIACTYRHELNQRYPIRQSYQIMFLKRLLTQLEAACSEINDVVYESYCQVLKGDYEANNTFAYKHYQLPAFNCEITLRESKNFVHEGTTGLCSWQASIALTDFLLHNPTIVKNKNIIELGAGTGLCGITLKRCLPIGEVLLTDGSSECVSLMHGNIMLNFNQTENLEKPKAAELLWDLVYDFPWSNYSPPQLLLAADVVYNDVYFDSLTKAIDYIFNLRMNQIELLLAATVRNEKTFDIFTRRMRHLNFELVEFDVLPPNMSSLFWERSTPTKILHIKR